MTRRAEHLPGLDGLRGVAIGCVLLAHANYATVVGADQGVTIFFVISGFIITRLLVAEHARTGRIALLAFYRRRFARLLPVFTASLVVTTVILLSYGYAFADFRLGLGASFGYFSNELYAVGHVVPGSLDDRWFRHTWSLSMEEQFYAVWPFALVVALRWRRGREALMVLAAALTVLPLVQRYHLVQQGAFFWRYKHGADTRVDALMLGCLLALALTWPVPVWVRRVLPVAGVLAAVELGRLIRRPVLFDHDPGAYTSVAVLSAVLVATVVLCPRSPLGLVLSTPPMLWLGTRSYSLYLWNAVFLQVLAHERHVSPAHHVEGWVWLGASLLAAEVSFRVIERPLRALLRGAPARDLQPVS